MDLEMWIIIGAIVVFVFVASLFKKGSSTGDSDYDRRLSTDVGVDSSPNDWGSDSGSDSCDSGDGGCDSDGGNDD